MVLRVIPKMDFDVTLRILFLAPRKRIISKILEAIVVFRGWENLYMNYVQNM